MARTASLKEGLKTCQTVSIFETGLHATSIFILPCAMIWHMALAYPGVVLVALVWILTPLIALPVAWVRWHRGSGSRDGMIFKGLISATIAFGVAAFPMIARSVNPNLWAGEMESTVAGALSLFGLPAALFAIYAAVFGEGRGRVALFLTGFMTAIYWFFGFLSIFKPRWLS